MKITLFFITVFAIVVASVVLIGEQNTLLSPFCRAMEGGVTCQVRQAEVQVSRQELESPGSSQGGSATSNISEEKLRGRSSPQVGKNEARGRPIPSGISGEEPQERPTTPLASWMRVGEDMRERAAHMRRVCEVPSVRRSVPSMPWTRKLYTLPGPFPVCVAPKVGSTTWRRFMLQFRQRRPKLRRDLRTLVVRHPLARLASAYRDKFLNGLPLKAYNKTFRTMTGSGQTWQYRWELYWLPSLVRKGLVKPPSEFFTTIREISRAFDYLATNFVDTSGQLHRSKASNTSYSQQALKTAMNMLSRSKQEGMVAAVAAGFSKTEQAKLKRKFGNVSFTMTEFLEHVLWTRNLGMVDQHWTPISELCDPCRINYTYVLRLENNPVESNYLLSRFHVLRKSLRTRHKSIGVFPDQSRSDLSYYENVPKDLMTKIQNMYKLDFELFGYDKNLI
nr:carbohydrate sulfotransferase 12-like [Procambarus clarkii]